MKLRILLVNPWIYDFAAYNLWAKPLGLLKVAEYLSSFDTDLTLIDCTDSFEPKKYGSGRFREEPVKKPPALRDIPRTYRRYGISIEEFIARVRAAMPVDLVMMTSIMSYWYPGVQKSVEIIRDIAGDVPVILGGIYATLYQEHASQNSGTDFIYKGSPYEGLRFAFHTFGFKLKKKREPLPYYRLNLQDEYPYAAILTASGCPFKCPYCASNLLCEGYVRRRAGDVLAEIRQLYGMGVRDFAFYDDALLVDPENHIKPLLKGVVESGFEMRFHTPNGLHAKFIDVETAALMRAANFRTIRLSLETVDQNRQMQAGRKVDNADVERAVGLLKAMGYTKKDIGVYLLCGLPGQDLKEVKEGIDFLKKLDVLIKLNDFSPVKGTRAWSELVQAGVIDDTLDPILTNNSVFPFLYSGYDPAEVNRVKIEVRAYNER